MGRDCSQRFVTVTWNLEMKTTLEHALPVLRLIKYTGFFPFKIEKTRVDHGKKTEVVEISLDNSWKYFIYQTIVFTYCFIRLIFGTHQLIMNWLNPFAVDGSLSIFSIVFTQLGMLGVTVRFNWRKKKLQSSWKSGRVLSLKVVKIWIYDIQKTRKGNEVLTLKS